MTTTTMTDELTRLRERALDAALERFAALVPYADEPATLKDTPAS